MPQPIPFTGLAGLAPSPGTIQADDYQRISPSPADFGALTGQADQGLGQGLQQVSDAAQRIQYFGDRAKVTDALTNAQLQGQAAWTGDPNDPNNPGLRNLRGQQAVAGFPAASRALTNAYAQARAGLDNSAQQAAFDRESRRTLATTMGAMREHVGQQQVQGAIDTANSAASAAVQQAEQNYNDPAMFGASVETAMNAQRTLGQAQGLPDDVIAQQQWQQRAQIFGRVGARIGADDAAKGLAFVKQNAAFMDVPTQTALINQLTPKRDREMSQAGLAFAVGGAGVTGLTAPAGPNAKNPIAPDQRPAMVQQAVAGTMVPASLLAAQVTQESGWDAGAVGSAGEVGLGQVKPSTAAQPGFNMAGVDPATLRDPQANLTFSARYLEARGKAAGLTTPADWQDPAKVAQALHGYNGGGDPNYASNVMRYLPGQASPQGVPAAAVGQSPGRMPIGQADMQFPPDGGSPQPVGGSVPPGTPVVPMDLGVALQRANAYAEANGLSPNARRELQSSVMAEHGRQQALTAGERESIERGLPDTLAALGQGLPGDVDTMRARINAAGFAPDQRTRMLDQLNIEQQGGALMAGLRFAPIDQVAETVQQLQVPGSIQAGRIVLRHGQAAGPGMQQPPGAPPAGAGQGGAGAALASAPSSGAAVAAAAGDQASAAPIGPPGASSPADVDSLARSSFPTLYARDPDAARARISAQGKATAPQKAGPVAPAAAPDAGQPPASDAPLAASPAAPVPPTAVAESPLDTRLRLAVGARVSAMAQRRQDILVGPSADPAAYASQQPDVAAKLNAAMASPQNPQAMADYEAATVGLQRQMGVPADQTRLMTNAQVGGLVSKLTKTDPAQGDTGQQLDAMAKQYGQYWPQMFGELVNVGRMSSGFQVLANMDAPGQVGARQDMQRMLAFTAQDGGQKRLMDALPPGDEQELRQGARDTIAPFRAAYGNNTGGLALAGDMQNAVFNLAAYRRATGAAASPGQALRDAYQDIIGTKYAIGGPGGTMVVRRMLDDGTPLTINSAIAATQAAQASLKPEDLRQIGPGMVQGLTPQDDQAAYLRDVKAQGFWVPNRDGSGLSLVRPVRNQRPPQMVLRPDGSQVSVKFRDMGFVPQMTPEDMATALPAIAGGP